jgi:hypothetical protein
VSPSRQEQSWRSGVIVLIVLATAAAGAFAHVVAPGTEAVAAVVTFVAAVVVAVVLGRLK